MMIKSLKNDFLNALANKDYQSLPLEESIIKICSPEQRKSLFSQETTNRRFSNADLKTLPINKDTPTFVIQHAENFESFPSERTLEQNNLLLEEMMDGIDNHRPFDQFIIEYRNDTRDISDFSKSQTMVSVHVDDDRECVVITAHTMAVIRGKLTIELNPISYKLMTHVDFMLPNDNNRTFRTPVFQPISTFNRPDLMHEIENNVFKQCDTILQKIINGVENHSDEAIDVPALINALQSQGSFQDALWALVNFFRLYKAVNVESVVVNAPKLPPKARKVKGNKYDRHNDYIVLKPKMTAIKHDSFQGDGTTHVGTPKRAHSRRGHLRKIKSGKTVYVNPCYIKGGSAGQSYII